MHRIKSGIVDMNEKSLAEGAPGVLEKAMGLLNIVSAKRAPMTFTQLLNEASLPKATLHRILTTLVREGLLRHDAYTKTFQLGFKLLQLAHEVWSDFDLRLAAQDSLVHLRDALGDASQLTVLEGVQVVVVASERAGRDGARVSDVGSHLPVHATAAGKAIAAHMDTKALDGLLTRLELTQFTTRTVTSLEAFRSELNLTRARGYAIAYTELDEESVSIAAPIFDYEGRAVGAVSIRSTASKIDVQRAHSLSSALISAARNISQTAAGEAMTLSPTSRPDMSKSIDVRCVEKSSALLGEGGIWSPRDNALYWVDILTPSVHSYQLDGRSSEIKLGTMASIAIPKATGGLLVATPGGLMTLDLTSKRLTKFAHPEAERPSNRYNDGKCDRRGRLWIGSMDMATAANRGSLFKVEADGAWSKMDSGFTVPNGIGWSPDDKKMYFTDTSRRTVYEYDFDLMTGTIENRRDLIVTSGEGRPDGLTVDDEGCLWIAMWDAWHIARYSPEGKEILRLQMPVPRPTSCCFGGPSLETLFITSASVRLTEETLHGAPLSGSLFAAEIAGVRGLPEPTFAG